MTETETKPECLWSLAKISAEASDIAQRSVDMLMINCYGNYDIKKVSDWDRNCIQMQFFSALEKVAKGAKDKALKELQTSAAFVAEDCAVGDNGPIDSEEEAFSVHIKVTSGGERTDAKKLKSELIKAGVKDTIINKVYDAATKDAAPRKSFSVLSNQ